jgi:L-2-hydroxyglutarate oxidase
MENAHVAIVGGGIVGLATAYELSTRHPDRRLVLFEKEPHLAAHQSGRNSGVLHSGIYYRPGSLKAHNCREGKQAMERFCDEQGVAFDICGKVIVAVNDGEVPRLENIYARGQANGIRCEMIGVEKLHELEPHASGVKAIHVPEAGIVDYRGVCNRLGQIIVERGGEIHYSAEVKAVRQDETTVVVETTCGEFETDVLVNCAGLHCDRVTRLSGGDPEAKIVPFRGEFFELKPDKRHLCRNLIYPVPDPSFPFLGVHFTRMIDGRVECGPNAVLAFAREGYEKLDIDLRDLLESLMYPGFLRLAARHWRVGAGEMWRSFSKAAFVKALRRLMPEIRSEDLDAARSGVRAQAVLPDGGIVDDFVIQSSGRIVNVGNAPSPAATSALNVGKIVVEKVATVFR